MIEINKELHVFDFSKDNQPVAFCENSDLVVFNTLDCYSDKVKTQDFDWDDFLIRVNPVTGPLYIKGAQPGDTILVKIVDIKLNETGIIVSKPYNGVFGKEIEQRVTKIVKISNQKVVFSKDLQFDIKPMIGCIGNVPIAGSIAANTPNNHGGNMDNSMISIGSIVELPVFIEGGLLAMGDLHAIMGNGEINGSGVECGGRVTVQINVIKGRRLTNPRVINSHTLYTIASGIDFDMAARIACKEMVKVIMEYNKIDLEEAGILMSAIGNLEVCQIVNPLVTARFGLDLRYLNYDIKEQ